MLALPHWHARCVCVFNLSACVYELECVGVEEGVRAICQWMTVQELTA